MMNSPTKILIVFLTSGMCSCSANWHLRKAIAKDPSILKPSHVTVYDTLLVPSVTHDTVFQIGTSRLDTVILVKDRLTIKHFYNTKDSTIYFAGECKPDTIIREIKVEVPAQVEYKEKPTNWLAILASIVLLFLAFLFLKKRVN